MRNQQRKLFPKLKKKGWYGGLKVRIQLIRENYDAWGPRVTDAAELVRLIGDEIRYSDRELLLSILLDSTWKILGIEEISKGSGRSLIASPREIFKSALLTNAEAVVLVHNHTAGDSTPSPADIRISERVAKAGKILGIGVADHIIIGKSYTSLFEKKLGPFKPKRKRKGGKDVSKIRS
ncbi:JAB domain-containing protein [candidate division WOR-3 bacterium]|nr:JAB domain-containing protein [candidate division WOR-3 bacterium]